MSQDKALVNLELLRVIQEESENKSISVETMFQIVENSLRELCRRKYGNVGLVVEVNRKNGSILIKRRILVVDDADFEGLLANRDEEDDGQDDFITLSDALKKSQDLTVGSVIEELLPAISADGLSLRGASAAVGNMIRKVERERQYNLYIKRVCELVNGVVRKVERNYIVVDLSDAEGFLPMRNLIKGEVYKAGDSIRTYIESVKRDDKNFQIMLSRTHNDFVASLFKSEIPEVYDGIIEVKKVVRDPGFRSKVAVYSLDKNIDMVGSCIGIKGSRIKAIVAELNGEKIDVISYSEDPALFVVNAMAPTEVVKVILDEDERNIELIVPDDQLSLAIGRHGQNVRLASALVGWSIDIIAEKQASEKRLEEFKKCTDMFIKELNAEEMIAQLLFAEGYLFVEDLACADVSDIASIEGFDLDIADEIIQRAKNCVEQRNNVMIEDFRNLGLDERLLEVPNLTPEIAVSLHKKGEIKSLEDFAGLSQDELLDIQVGLEPEMAAESIMFARKQLNWID